MPDHDGDGTPSRALHAIRALCWLSIAAFVVIAVVTIAQPYDLDMYEGVIFAPALRLGQGQPAYGSSLVLHEPYLFATYGPLYYAVLGLVLRVTGVTFWPGRLLSAGSTLGVAALLSRLPVREGVHGRLGGLVSAALFLLLPPAWSFGALQRVDAFGILWLTVAITLTLSRRDSRWAAPLSGVAAGLGFLIKASLVACVLPLIGWQFHRRRADLGLLIAAGWLLAAAAATLGLTLTGNTGYLFNLWVIWETPLGVSSTIGDLRGLMLGPAAVAISVLALLATADQLRERKPGIVSFALPYVVLAGGWNAFTASHGGASVNHFMELSLALAICSGAGFTSLVAERSGARVAATLMTVALALQLGFVNVGSLRHRLFIPQAKARQHEAVLEHLRRLPAGTVLAGEYSDLLLRAGGTVFFNDLSMYQVGPADVRALLADALATRRIAALVVAGGSPPPGYRAVATPRYADPQWAVTQSIAGPLLFVRGDLADRLDP